MKIGDVIAVIDDDLEGTVTNIIQDEVYFETSEGFSYRYPKKKVVVISQELGAQLYGTPVKSKDFKTSNIRAKASEKTPVFDLHIEKILTKHQHLSPGHKLDLQLKEVQNILHKISRQHYKEFVLIHGQGKGVLRHEIEKLLHQKGFAYSDASYRKYGQGAILVLKN